MRSDQPEQKGRISRCAPAPGGDVRGVSSRGPSRPSSSRKPHLQMRKMIAKHRAHQADGNHGGEAGELVLGRRGARRPGGRKCRPSLESPPALDLRQQEERRVPSGRRPGRPRVDSDMGSGVSTARGGRAGTCLALFEVLAARDRAAWTPESQERLRRESRTAPCSRWNHQCRESLGRRPIRPHWPSCARKLGWCTTRCCRATPGRPRRRTPPRRRLRDVAGPATWWRGVPLSAEFGLVGPAAQSGSRSRGIPVARRSGPRGRLVRASFLSCPNGVRLVVTPPSHRKRPRGPGSGPARERRDAFELPAALPKCNTASVSARTGAPGPRSTDAPGGKCAAPRQTRDRHGLHHSPGSGFPKPGEPGRAPGAGARVARRVDRGSFCSSANTVHQPTPPGRSGVKQIKFGMGKGIEPVG